MHGHQIFLQQMYPITSQCIDICENILETNVNKYQYIIMV